jgi:phage tail sheath protein FI
MLNLQTPGVYVREVEVPQTPLLRMSITGFVGQAERGPLNSPQRIESLGQFRDIFGDFVGYSYLPYSIFGFFLNGGERCYVVRVAHESALCARLSETASPLIKVQAINEGAWGNSIRVQIDPKSSDDIILTEIESPIARGQTIAHCKSVAGLARGDVVTLVHKRDPIRAQLTIAEVDPVKRELTFQGDGISNEFGFPTGSGVIGRGFGLTFRFCPAGKLVREEVFENLSLNPDSPRYFASVINGDPELTDYVLRNKNGNSILVRVGLRSKSSYPRPASLPGAEVNLEHGAERPEAVTAEYFTGYQRNVEAYFRPIPPQADAAATEAAAERLNGLAAFELIDEIGLIAIPDLIIPDLFNHIPPEQIPKAGIIFAGKPSVVMPAEKLENLKTGQQEMLRHCERTSDRFAILDSPRGAEAGKGANRIEDWPGRYYFSSLARFGALYYPWIREKSADFKGLDLMMPPSGHLAGIYARTEQRASVGRAPANELLHGVIEFEFCLSDAEQAILNPRGVNCLRSFPGRGLLVWGARTLSQDPAWRYVNTSRVVLATIKQILMNLQWTVFEPNDRVLWSKIVAALTFFLRDLFQMGVLAGNTAAEAFFVKCDDETNPPEVIERGEVITRIGLAPARPAEFVVVTIKRTSEAVSVSEGISGRS